MSDKDAKAAPPPPGGSPWMMMLMILMTFWICQRGQGGDPKQQMHLCGVELHKVGVALEKFRFGSEGGLYPKTLAEAFQNKAVPVCPVGGKEAYPNGYQPASDRRSYVQVCKGAHHLQAGVPSDYPRIAFKAPESPAAGEESSPQASPSSPAPATPVSAPQGAITETAPSRTTPGTPNPSPNT